jgi:hypothetical protein
MVLAEDDETPESAQSEKRPRTGKAAEAGMRLRLAVVVSHCLELML